MTTTDLDILELLDEALTLRELALSILGEEAATNKQDSAAIKQARAFDDHISELRNALGLATQNPSALRHYVELQLIRHGRG
jgi:hypothetical protein